MRLLGLTARAVTLTMTRMVMVTLESVVKDVRLRLRHRLVLLLPEEDAAPLFLPATFPRVIVFQRRTTT